MAPSPFRRRDVIAGKWEDRGSTLTPPFRCRWFFSWTEYAPARIAGFFAGYEGGGAFIGERFHAAFEGDRLTELVWNAYDHVAGMAAEAMFRSPDVDALVERHAEAFLRWHDRDRWEEGFLCLAAGREKGLVMPPDALYLPPKHERSGLLKIGAMLQATGIATRIKV
ncbi:hypothetical protein [Aerolutibacter ruishenii]|uniref:Uncharacterized protein n=1 Tax=Aerolutibacter ruishenii TaxID=686800 RepID=A0A562M0W8_9GAMM|nr:hypothetical protein [Lysobacter ruishenii]TWI13530.1 hypothetical protein IP93_00692 [Lysobacter ruishenii]